MSTPELLSRYRPDLEEKPEHIEQEKIIPLFAVTQVLSRNGVASVGLFRLHQDSTQRVSAWIGENKYRFATERCIEERAEEGHSVRSSMLRIWELGKANKKTGTPTILRSITAQPSNKPHPVSCIALSATLSCLAIGLGDGSVLDHHHLGQSIFSGSLSLTAVPKPRIVHESPTTTNGVADWGVQLDFRATNILLAHDGATYECSVGGRVTSYAYGGNAFGLCPYIAARFLLDGKQGASLPYPRICAALSLFHLRLYQLLPRHQRPGCDALESKIIAYSGAIPEGVREVVSEWGHIYVIADDGKLSCLVEKPTSRELAMLYQRGFYPLVISLAKTQRLDDAHVADVHRQYGDHIHSKGGYDGAMQQFVLAIGHTQPSYVVRKELHSMGLANSDHTTKTYLRVRIEDAGNYKNAMLYLRRLGSEAAESNLARYGRAMLANLPEETAQLLIDICTVSGPSVKDEEKPVVNSSTLSGGPSYLSYLALSRAAAAPAAPPNEIGTHPSPSVKTVKPGDAPESIHNRHSGASTPATVAPASRMPNRPPVEKPFPRPYFSHFVDHMRHFVTFLETIARRRWGQSITNTTVEISQKNGDSGVEEDADWRDQVTHKVLCVLENEHILYGATHALTLCSAHNITQSLVLLWEKLGMYEDVLRFWMDQHNPGKSDAASGEIVKALKAYGPNHPHLYALVLHFLMSTPELLSRHQTDLEEILEHIEQEKIMPPLGVIQVLSRNGVASAGLAKQWSMPRIKESPRVCQQDGEYGITFPKAYHAGFNRGVHTLRYNERDRAVLGEQLKFEASALSASSAASKEKAGILVRKKGSILRLGLPPTMRLPSVCSGSTASSIIAKQPNCLLKGRCDKKVGGGGVFALIRLFCDSEQAPADTVMSTGSDPKWRPVHEISRRWHRTQGIKHWDEFLRTNGHISREGDDEPKNKEDEDAEAGQEEVMDDNDNDEIKYENTKTMAVTAMATATATAGR
ncbi:hypothetical protein BJ138DRAFT_1221838 [Hygrophoropsis aurantiaca]|uniref:Uncharacterized protein n=1 Tax=Hygrophoropsis aurantiaca TaxID=72124 RepID=A0ACB8A0B3_9AGAM|nr:hypothetical protein BJ138DRAFT_1221838 [Hygrophoropsis aurantiaca]